MAQARPIEVTSTELGVYLTAADLTFSVENNRHSMHGGRKTDVLSKRKSLRTAEVVALNHGAAPSRIAQLVTAGKNLALDEMGLRK